MNAAPASNWKVVLDKHQTALVEELSSCLEADREAERQRLSAEHQNTLAEQVQRASREARTEGREAAQRTTAEALNQALRRLRQAESETAAFEVLADATAAWSQKALVLSLDEGTARSVASRGVDQTGITLKAAEAGAVHAAMESKDPVIAMTSAKELSPELAAALANGTEDGKAYLFPVVVRQSVVAMLIAAGVVVPAPLELLCEAAAMKLELLSVPVAAPAPVAAATSVGSSPAFVQIEATPKAPSAPAPQVPGAWDELSAEEQKLHLQAQRVARVRVAELRLYNSEELRKGAFNSDIYGALRTGIDAARAEFLQTFLSKSPSMVDYLHLEILRSLAHEDARLLGKDYPGPMV